MMASCHEWIVYVGTLSCYDRMTKKEMEKEKILEETSLDEDGSWLIKRIKKDISLQSKDKTW